MSLTPSTKCFARKVRALCCVLFSNHPRKMPHDDSEELDEPAESRDSEQFSESAVAERVPQDAQVADDAPGLSGGVA